MKKIFSLLLMMSFIFTMFTAINVNALGLVATNDILLQYKGHVQDIGWQGWTGNDTVSGTVGKSKRIEGINIKIQNAPSNVQIRYQAHVQNIGWQNWVQDGTLAGTTGQSLRVEALKIELLNAPAGYHVQYSAHVQNIGWQDYVQDEQIAGTTGQGLQLEAIKIRIVKDDKVQQSATNNIENVSDSSRISIQSTFQSTRYTVGEDIVAGDPNSGLQLESIAISNRSLPQGTRIKYQSHVQNIGWQDFVYDGELSGTSGKNLRLEAFNVQLIGAPKGYSIKYQSYVDTLGWQDWVSNGQASGTLSKSLKIKAIKIKIEYDPNQVSGVPSVNYQTIVQNQGWNPLVADNGTSGQPGSGLRIEGLKINLQNATSTIGIKYQAHIQNIGWQNWAENGQFAGTTGQNLRIEGIRIQLTGSTQNYHVLYKAYVEGYGWQNWVKDGEIAGIVARSKKIEALIVKIVDTTNPSQFTAKKIAIDPGHNASPDIGATGIRQEDNMTMEVSSRVIEKLKQLGYNVIDVLPPSATTVRDSLQQRTNVANANEVDKFVSIHFNKFNGLARGTEVFYYNSSSTGMAQNVLNSIISNLGFYNRGVKYADYYVLRTSNAPAILIEGCFLDSSMDMNIYNADKLSDAIVSGITK